MGVEVKHLSQIITSDAFAKMYGVSRCHDRKNVFLIGQVMGAYGLLPCVIHAAAHNTQLN